MDNFKVYFRKAKMVYIYIDESGVFEPDKEDKSRWIIQAGFATRDESWAKNNNGEFKEALVDIVKRNGLSDVLPHAADFKSMGEGSSGMAAYFEILAVVKRMQLEVFCWKSKSSAIVDNFMGDHHGFRTQFFQAGLVELSLVEDQVIVYTDNTFDSAYLYWKRLEKSGYRDADISATQEYLRLENTYREAIKKFGGFEKLSSGGQEKYGQNLKDPKFREYLHNYLDSKLTKAHFGRPPEKRRELQELADFKIKAYDSKLVRDEFEKAINALIGGRLLALGRKDIASYSRLKLFVLPKEERNFGVIAADFISNAIFSKLEKGNASGYDIIRDCISWDRNWTDLI